MIAQQTTKLKKRSARSMNRRSASTSESPTARGTMRIPIDRIFPHPANRTIRDEACADLAESIRTEGQLQPIQVRTVGESWDLPADAYQIVFGERRWRACRLAGIATVEAAIVELSDAEVLRVMAVENAERQNLNPIEQAEAIDRLCRPTADGGGGLTREQAGAIFGLKTGSAASNKVRLLQLPEQWRQRIISGELGESFARHLLPYCHLPTVMQAIEEEYSDSDEWNAEQWQTREGFAAQVDYVVRANTRPLSQTEKKWDPEFRESVACLFEPESLPEETREKLGVASITLDGETVEVATNVELYRDLQKEAWESSAAVRKSKRKSKADGKATPNAKSEKELAEQLSRRVDAWRQRWLRFAIAERLDGQSWQAHKLLAWIFVEGPHLRSKEAAITVLERSGAKRDSRGDYWGQLGKYGKASDPHLKAEEWKEYFASLMGAILVGPLDREPGHIPPSVVYGVFEDLGLALQKLWREEQQTGAGRQRLLQLFEIYPLAQLTPIAEQLGVPMAAAKTKRVALQLIEVAMQSRSVPLPEIVEWRPKQKPKATTPSKSKRSRKLAT